MCDDSSEVDHAFIGNAVPAANGWTRAAPIACGCAIVAGTVYIALNDPAAPGTHLPACPFYAMTGLWCPGCGLTRAAHSLFRGDLAGAFGFNLFFPLFLGGIVVGWFAWMRQALGRAPMAWLIKLPVWLAAAAGAALLGFGVFRNLPGLEALAP
jgi:hypothetical protein